VSPQIPAVADSHGKATKQFAIATAKLVKWLLSIAWDLCRYKVGAKMLHAIGFA
jgi:hypothetical protein